MIDVILYALDMEWELSEDAVTGSEVLSNLLNEHHNTASKLSCISKYFCTP